MDRVFFEQLELFDAKYNLDVGSGTHAEQTGKMLIRIENALLKERPDIVLVEGDTNTTLAGALAAVKLHIKVGHVEAGLRSYDRLMPEEINRILVDHCSDLLFAPTERSKQNLLREGILGDGIFVTGNTMVDAIYKNLEISKKRNKDIHNHLNINYNEYFLATAHRQENIDDKERFLGILKGLEIVQEKFGFPVIYPIHPRAKKQLKILNVKINKIRIIEPLDYLSFLQLESGARLILTDSGGVQEEACVLGIPCVTLRYNTERPETLEVGSNILAGTNPQKIVKSVAHMMEKKNCWDNPFGDGRAGERIIQLLRSNFDKRRSQNLV